MAATQRQAAILHPYIDGNTVRKHIVAEPVITRPEHREDSQIRKNRAKATRMNKLYLIVLTVAIIATVGICISYLQQQASATATLRNIDALEDTYKAMVVENDAKELKIESSIDLNYIYQVATAELGMVNSNQDQVRLYQRVEGRYVRQNENIPSN